MALLRGASGMVLMKERRALAYVGGVKAGQ